MNNDQNHISHKRHSFVSFIYTLLLTSLAAYMVIKSLRVTVGPGFLASEIASAILYGTAVTGTFLMLFHDGIARGRLNPLADPRRLLPLTCLAQSIGFASHHLHFMSQNVFFITTLGIQTLTTWLAFRVALTGINLSPASAKPIAAGASLMMAFYGLMSWPLRNFWSTTDILISAAVFQALIHSVGLIGVTTWFCVHPHHRLDPSSLWQSIRLRTAQNSNKISTLTGTIVAAIVQVIGIIITLTVHHTYDTGYPDTVAVLFQVLFIPAMIDAWGDMSRIGFDQERLREMSRLSLQAARQMFQRHNQKTENWAATVGMKTACVTLEHDVENLLAGQLPATLLRIRSEETANFVRSLAGHQAIFIQSMSDKINCSVDPEKSQRPCLDALKLCAALYLDAGALLERRMSGLMSLLPIVNPGLSSVVNKDSATASMKRARWFFYFDYAWIDQSIVNTSSESNYSIQLDRITPELRLAIIQHMEKTHGIGNYIWLGQQAHERLLREAPSLSSIIEPHALSPSEKKEHLVFAIKFEQLVPRLQRYYGLDDLRTRIVDFEPSANAQKLLNILLLQINNASKDSDILRIVDAIATYRWRGFREKDQALQLLHKVYQRTENTGNQFKIPEQLKFNIQSKLFEAISAIGYPSQLMNQAHIYKLELRTIAHLRNTALDPTNPRYPEAWVSLSNIDYRKLPQPDLQAIAAIIKNSVKRRDIISEPNVQARILDCCVALLQRHPNERWSQSLLRDAVDTITSLRPDPESASMIIDTLTFAEQVIGESVQLSTRTEKYFETLCNEQANSADSWQQAVANRWLEYKSERGSAKAKPRAS